MKKNISVLLLLFGVVLSGCTSTALSKYRVNAVYNKLPAPQKGRGLACGYIYSKQPLREVIVVKVDDGRLFRADLVPSNPNQGFSKRGYYLANLPQGEYGLYRVIASSSRTTYTSRGRSVGIRYLYLTFPAGTKKLRFKVSADKYNYFGALAFFQLTAKQKIKRWMPSSNFYREMSGEQGLIDVVDLKKRNYWKNIYKSLLISYLNVFRSRSEWLPLMKKYFPDYKLWVERKLSLDEKDARDEKGLGNGERIWSATKRGEGYVMSTFDWKDMVKSAPIEFNQKEVRRIFSFVFTKYSVGAQQQREIIGIARKGLAAGKVLSLVLGEGKEKAVCVVVSRRGSSSQFDAHISIDTFQGKSRTSYTIDVRDGRLARAIKPGRVR